PRNGIGFVAPHHEAADLLLAVDEAIGIAQRRHVARHAVDRLGDEILVLNRLQRHGYARELAHVTRPLARAVDDHIGRDVAIGGTDADGTAIPDLDRRNPAILDDAHAGG